MKPALHILSLPHTSTTKEYVSCAYTTKAKNFSTMLASIDYTTYLYGGPENEADCTEHIVINSDEDQERWFGDFDFHKNFFPITWNPNDDHWRESNAHAINEIGQRIKPKDIICVIAGTCQQAIAEAFPNNPTVEYGIGYCGVFAPFKVFESYPHMHYVYGASHDDNGKFYDAVIPNYFDPDDFTFESQKDDYFVFLGRFIQRKGPEIAVEVTRRLGKRLIMAGQGARQEGSTVYSDEGWSLSGDHIEHIGHVDVDQRAKLLSKAKAVFMPTTYLEPFGGVHVEAMMSGTPVIATDFGVFAETVVHGEVGFRFRTIGEATHYASIVDELDPTVIRNYAVDNFSMDRVKYLYDDYFQQIMTLYEKSDHPDGFRRDGFYSDWHGREDRYSRFLSE